MKKAVVTISMSAALLWGGTALALPTGQQNCDRARVKAWTKYVSCVGKVVGKDAYGLVFNFQTKFAKCRHKYFKRWTQFQTDPLLTGSTCVGSRFVDNGATATDNLTELVWEKKTTDSSVHDATNSYPWFGAFTTFLGGLSSFDGAGDWRIPTLAELQTIQLDFVCNGAVYGGPHCSCPSFPCVDPALGPTHPSSEWTTTTYLPSPSRAWSLNITTAVIYNVGVKGFSDHVRAVRGGLL